MFSRIAGVVVLGGAMVASGQVARKAPAKTTSGSSRTGASKAVAKDVLVPLTTRERAQQMLNRFTFGARPGEVERVLAQGPDAWFEEQLNPSAIKDDVLAKRLGDFPTLALSPEQALQRFPDRREVEQVANGSMPMPTDPLLASVYEVQVWKYNNGLMKTKAGAADKKAADKTPEADDDETADAKRAGRAEAARIAGVLYALPRNQRMGALIKMPVADRVAFTSYLQGDQKNLLLAECTPRERETFTAMAAKGNSAYQIGQELAQAKMVRAILSERQVQEVMADFWFNHFNVFFGKESDKWYTTSYDRDAIRKNALGKFRDLLLATAMSPAMMVYLDNWTSIGPDSKANTPGKGGGKAGTKGLNENYGREVMELHTVGVDGGYTQADVTALASILTGWSVDKPQQAGGFVFEPRKHEPGTKQWFGHTIPEGGMQEGVQALTLLAASPKTAHFISWKLAQRFVADEPPPALVDRMAKTYLDSDGDIKAVLRTLVESPEFNSKKYFRNKVKTPVEYLASAFRTTGTDPMNPGALVNTAKTMGMPLFYALPPTGYYITADKWMNSSALVDRLNFAYQMTNDKFANQKFDAPHVLAMGLMTQPAGVRPVGMTDGVDVVLGVLETTMVGQAVSPKTNELIHAQVDGQAGLGATERLNLLTALVMGSPEFQVR